jgi:hypothetical protein
VISPSASADKYTRSTEELIEHVDKTYKHGADISASLQNLAIKKIAKPKDPATGVETERETNKEIWKQEIRAYVARKAILEENLQKAYALIWGQCSDPLRAKLESAATHDDVATAKDSIALLKSIRATMYMSHAQRYEPLTCLDGLDRFIRLHQGKHQSLSSYLESFRNCTDVLDYMTVEIGISAKGIETELGNTPDAFGRPLSPDKASEGELVTAKACVKEAFMAVKFLAGADKARYGTVIQDLENDYTKKDDNFPKTVVDAYNLLMHWKQAPSQQSPIPTHGVAFMTSGSETPEYPNDNAESGGRGRGGGRGGGGRGNPGRGGRGGRGWGRGNCYRCGQPGHFASECPAPTPSTPPEETAEQLLMDGVENDEFDDTEFVFHQLDESQYESERKHIPSTWILLDNQSTVDVFANRDLMRNIHTTTRSMTIRCNAGVTQTNMIGRVEGYPGEVWYNPHGIANILSLSNVTKYFPVSYDSRDDEGFVVHKATGDRRFTQSGRGLFFLDTGADATGFATALVNSGAPGTEALPDGKTGVRAKDARDEHPSLESHGVENVVGLTDHELVAMADRKRAKQGPNGDRKDAVGVTLLNTVEENKTLYNAAEQARALLARRIQNMIGHPSTKDFK